VKTHSAILLYACVGRFYAQALEQEAEMSRIVGCMKGSGIPYLAAYAGNEICPVYGADGLTSNRVHNNSVIICAL
jgi:hypothetical protein